MIEFRPFEQDHLKALALDGAQCFIKPLIEDPDYGAALKVPELAYTAFKAGRPIGCAGVLPLWPGSAKSWTVIESGAFELRDWVVASEFAAEGLERAHRLGYRRIEAAVHVGFVPGKRWARRLGFEAEGLMRRWGPDGADYLLYARIR